MLRKPVFKSGVAGILAALFFAMAGCSPDPFYIGVEFIEGVPDTGTAGTPLVLTGTIRPAFASNKDIVWSVKDAGTTGASISGLSVEVSAGGYTVPTNNLTVFDAIFTGIAGMKTWLDAQGDNTADTPYHIALSVSDLSGALGTAGSVANALSANDTKYVFLDLSGSTFTGIGDAVFSECYNLTGVTIPDSVTSIGDGAFSLCTRLTGVTFEGADTAIVSNNSFPDGGSLITEYSNGGEGTYTRTNSSNTTWTKQQ